MYTKTTFPKFDSELKICPGDLIYTCGSCFAQEFYNRLTIRKFHLAQHPFGIVFNPLSITKQFDALFSKKKYEQNDLIYHNGLYHSMDHHGSYSGFDADAVLHHINSDLDITRKALLDSACMILTLGSAHCYIWNQDRQVVANCHKLPATEFSKHILDLDKINDILERLFQQLHQQNPKLQIIISISPVRYLKDGFIENNRSKARLLLAAENLVKKFSYAHYFPAYEIFQDDLRDYRYVKEDLIHPDKKSIDYIWSYFEHAYLGEESKKLIRQMDQLLQLFNHKILHKDSPSYVEFLDTLKHKINSLQSAFPHLDFSHEREKFKSLQT